MLAVRWDGLGGDVEADVKVELKIEGDKELVAILQRLGAGLMQAVQFATEDGAEVAKNEAIMRGPGPFIITKVGKVERGKAEVGIGPDRAHWYYVFFETGVDRHEIDGNMKKALRFDFGGEEVIVKRIKHPGMAAEPFLRPALEENQERIKAAMGETFREVIERLI